jgi:YHS domain-containing protein
MLTFREIHHCAGYFYNQETGEILRNIGPGTVGCWREGSWTAVGSQFDPDVPLFELVTSDVSAPIEAVLKEVHKKYGRATSAQMVNRQTRRQADGRLITEETHMTPQQNTVTDPVCKMEIDPKEAAGRSDYQGRTYYFCAASCKQQFDQNPERYVKKG